VGSRSYIAAGTMENTDANLAKWIQNPQGWKQGVLMPNLGIKDDEAQALVAYLRANQ
jgi:cytochrome c oxidase subunit 2